MLNRLLATLALFACTTSAYAQTETEKDAPSTLREAIEGGHSWLNFRYRAELVDVDTARDAFASTLRTVFGYETATYRDFTLSFEFEDTTQVGDDMYNSGTNGKGAYATVADPIGSAVNQAFVRYTGLSNVVIGAGRQEIVLDNARFIGNVGWRQNHQSFDSVAVTFTGSDGTTATYAFVDDVQRVSGATLETDSHLFNFNHKLGDVGSITGYYYRLEFPSAAGMSSGTFGLRFTGQQSVDDVDILYTAELASQRDAGSNPNSNLGEDYLFLELGAKFNGITAKIGSETLGGSGSPGDGFQTPLATGHTFNGYADQFLTTPIIGLQDFMFTVQGKIGPVDCAATYHKFDSDQGSTSFGDEIDLVFGYAISDGCRAGFKFADFSADDAGTGKLDTTKAMFWLTYAVL